MGALREAEVKRAKWTKTALVAAVVTGVLVGATPMAALAGSGTKGCANPAKYGWLYSSTTGYTESKPPGSSATYFKTAGGTYDLVAMSGGLPKAGGGAWSLSAGNITVESPNCKNYG